MAGSSVEKSLRLHRLNSNCPKHAVSGGAIVVEDISFTMVTDSVSINLQLLESRHIFRHRLSFNCIEPSTKGGGSYTKNHMEIAHILD